MKTDNTNLVDKLGLRRYFLDCYHKGQKIKVFDACQGEQVLWGILRKEYPCRYWGVDVKNKKGRPRVNSERVLAEAGWDFDVIDVDTYGQPWRHWEGIIKNGTRDVTVFLTIGMVNVQGGSLQKEARDAAFPAFASMPKPPLGLFVKFSGYVIVAMLYHAKEYGWRIVEATTIEEAKNVKYVGIRIERLKKTTK